ncbi:hypothetical protein HPB49_015400 [Dermacentor silvarum]|uniref:Uncharacterized protein n=1 Tax=Dermacentor silvarum TaxID=543639 RepID=A0ACB8CS02_DERSI|nr:hypothetical protein HPB49_015400 [Dermacentor silvarum]
MNYAVANAGMLAEAMESSSSLKCLTIFGIASDQPEVIRESAVKVCSLDYSVVFPHDYVHSLDSMPIPVHLLEQRAARLTSLDVLELQMSPFTSKKLIESLIKNHTITDVAVGACVFASGPFDGQSPSFEKYLLKENATLRKLTLRGPQFDNETAWLPNLARAISTMTTLQELDAEWLGTSQHCELFFTFVSRNRFLRSLKLQLAGMDHGSLQLQRHEDVEAVNDRSWVSALQENSALQKLDLDLSWSTTENCCLLVRALANNHCLQSLTLRYLPDVDRLEEVCSAIRKSELVNRVYIAEQCLERFDAPALSEFPEVTAINVRLIFLDDAARMQCFFQRLVASNDISSLSVTFEYFDEGVCAALATYIKGASALKEIELHTIDYDDEWDVDDETLVQAISNLCKALCSNLGITKISLDWSVKFCDEDCQALAHAVLRNRRLHELTLKIARYDYRAVLLRHLLPRFHQNYSLLRLEIPVCIEPYANIFAAQEIVRRNCSLIERATRFVLGDHDPYCARAVEFVSEHPKLVDNVRREAALSGEAEAVALIRGAVRRLCLADVHEFMRLTGVVQERVVCHAREDGVTQFDKLNHECWLHIRRYLIVADVVEP